MNVTKFKVLAFVWITTPENDWSTSIQPTNQPTNRPANLQNNQSTDQRNDNQKTWHINFSEQLTTIQELKILIYDCPRFITVIAKLDADW